MELAKLAHDFEPEIEELTAGDTATVQAVFDSLSAKQRYHRFHVTMPRLPHYLARLLADVDGSHHAALVLKVGGVPAGIARYIVTGFGEAEFSIAVGAAYVERGYGTGLMEALMTHARAHGITQLNFVFLAENRVAHRLVLRHGATVSLTDGLFHGFVPTTQVGQARRRRRAATG